MSARSQALVPLSTEQPAAWRAVAETEKRRHQGNSLSDLRFFMPSLTAYFHERRSLNNFHRDRVITFEQIAE